MRLFRVCVTAFVCCVAAHAQTSQPVPATPEKELERLSTAITQVQSQVEAYQKQLLEMQQQLAALKQQMAATAAAAPGSSSKPTVEERIETVESQIATHDTLKVESSSKYPVTLMGLIVFNGYVNTHRVDAPASPAYAYPGGGNTGFSMRQTILGIDARGPHLWGATSHADIRMDFFGSSKAEDYSSGGLVRLRTAHASLRWKDTEAYGAYDRTILAPDAPTSLSSLAIPLLSWSGNLWTWNPQIGVSHNLAISETSRITLQTALIDVLDPLLPSAPTPTPSSTTLAERSRWPGVQTRVAFGSRDLERGAQFGLGGYFSPHRTPDRSRFDSWAATADLRLPIGHYLQLTSNVYRGAGLGGLGAGGYVDYIYRDVKGVPVVTPLDDVGGWAQLKLKTGRFDTNVGYGLDNPFGKQVRARYSGATVPQYAGLSRNSTFYVNSIYSPSAYLQFSLEYKRLQSTFGAGGGRYPADAIGVAGAYRF